MNYLQNLSLQTKCLLVALTGEVSVVSNCNSHRIFNDGIRKYGDMNCPQGNP